MNNKVNNFSSFNCNICNKYYSSKSSLCNHNKKFHIINVHVVHDTVNVLTTNVHDNINNQKKYNCKNCNKQFNSRQGRCNHHKICKVNIQDEKNKEIEKLKDENKQKELELLLKMEETKIKKTEAKILQLKLKLEQSNNIDNITLKKINKKLIERNNLIKKSTINIQNNNIINNYQLIGFGKEDIVETLSKHDMKAIMNSKYNCLEKLVEIVHCGKYNQFKNIIITNMNNNYMYKYDDKKGYFVLSTKSEVLNSLVDYRIGDLEIIYNELLTKNKIDDNTKDIIEKFINKINYDNTKFTDFEGKNHENYKQYKINEIKMLLFNNQDKINNDISLFLTTNEIDYEPPLTLLDT